MSSALPFSQPGNWYKGNLHSHSTVSDGLLPPEKVIDFYRSHGYHFLALTEHRLHTPGELIAPGEFITLGGIELDGYEEGAGMYHLVGLGQRRAPDMHIEGSTSMQGAVEALRAEGGIVYLAHPYWSGQMSRDLLGLKGCFGLEVWNSGCEVWDCKGISTVHWDDLLASGHLLGGVAADDCHWWEGREDAGLGWVWVRAESLTPEAILTSLERGWFYASTGPQIHDVRLEGDRVHVRCSPVVSVDFIGNGPMGRRVLAPAGASLTEADYTLEASWSFQTPAYLRVACVDAQGRWAWSNPLRLPGGPPGET